jgi:hypothetical protein
MPSYLDFDSTKNFRDFILGKTLQQPNGPQSFSSNTYYEQNLSNMNNVGSGGVDTTTPTVNQTQALNTFNTTDVNVFTDLSNLPRRANLNLYPYFVSNDYSLVGIALSNSSYETESELFKFAASNIRNNPQGPVISRLAQNIEKNTLGRARILDALNGNTTTAINIITGREPLVEANYKITVDNTISIPGQAANFLNLVAGTELPFTIIPGNLFNDVGNPLNNNNTRPTATSEVGRIYQDVTGTLGSLIGIQRRPLASRKPSDILLQYMGSGQKNRLYESLSYNKYGPDYSTSGMSQNTSAVFKGLDNILAKGKKILGIQEGKRSGTYIGDDRKNNLESTIHDGYDRPYQSSYYLSQLFDPIAVDVFRRSTSISEGGNIASNFTWVSQNRKTSLGANNPQWSQQSTLFEKTMSTNSEYSGFTHNSILDITKQMLVQPNQVSWAIDQTSRVFKDGDFKMSKGSAIKYTDKYSKDEAGVEYCRVWTKDRAYSNYSSTMKRNELYRKFDGSVMGGASRPWNLNIAPMSNGKKSFENSTNIKDDGNGFYAKKYMFSIENLAWKTSNLPGFQVSDLPACERGPNGGRVMWFPPYDLKVSEQNNANWDKNVFIGRPEPIYTYLDSERNGTVSFKVIVDHPSILNLLVREYFKGMSDEEADNYINAFFAGCQDLDFYALIQKYATLDKNDVDLIKQYLNAGTTKEVINSLKFTSQDITETTPESTKSDTNPVNLKSIFYFPNAVPYKNTYSGKTDALISDTLGTYYIDSPSYITLLGDELHSLTGRTGANDINDKKIIFNKTTDITEENINLVITQTQNGFSQLNENLLEYNAFYGTLKNDISGKTVTDLEIKLHASCSALDTTVYNFFLGVRRNYSILVDFLKNISKTPEDFNESALGWPTDSELNGLKKEGLKFTNTLTYKDLGWDLDGKIVYSISTTGEEFKFTDSNNQGIDCHGLEIKNQNLAKHAPIPFFCRQGEMTVDYNKTNTTVVPPQSKTVNKLHVDPDQQEVITKSIPKPPIDVMKRIIMKTLSECFYFKKLEEDSPLIFTSLKEKLKYFHPSFHSMTPEGLNSRLTFLLQCLRPGDTIPVMNGKKQSVARNTTFGPPPICVIRIGDFYHSKIIIRDININYDDSPWDFNPEGIGVQPMIATVTLQVAFIGGQGLERPVERLQNSLSSNFFANTEMYDERSESTATTIGGKKYDDFTKEFLEKLTDKPEFELLSDLEAKKTFKFGKFIGEIIPDVNTLGALDYTNLINDLYKLSSDYVQSYKDTYYDILDKFSKKITGLYLSSNYRTINKLDIVKNENMYSSPDKIEMLGAFDPILFDLSTLINSFGSSLKDVVDFLNVSVDVLKILDPIQDEQHIQTCETEIKFLVKNVIDTKIEEMLSYDAIKKIEDNRNKIITIVDQLNFITNYKTDAMISGNTESVSYMDATLNGFVSSDFYNSYSNVIDYINTSNTKLKTYIDNTIDFGNESTLTTQMYPTSICGEIILTFLKGKESDIIKTVINAIGTDTITTTFVENLTKQVNSILFITTDVMTVLDIPTAPTKTNTKSTSFNIVENNQIFDVDEGHLVNKIFAEKLPLTDKLNFYKP